MSSTAQRPRPAPSHAERASHLRRQAERTMHPFVANAYRRRASELELIGWVRALCEPRPDEQLLSA